MQIHRFAFIAILLLLLSQSSCKKEIKNLIGKYSGTVRLVVVNQQNPTLNKDTLYTNVLLEVTEGSESSRKEAKADIVCTTIQTRYNENIPINKGVINYRRTNRGEPGMYYSWNGEIRTDSLKLNHKHEHDIRGYEEWIFRARKQ